MNTELEQLCQQYPYQPSGINFNTEILTLLAAVTIEFGCQVGFTQEPEAVDVYFLSTLGTFLGVGVATLGVKEIATKLNKIRTTNTISFTQNNNQIRARFQRGLNTYTEPIYEIYNKICRRP